MTYEESAALMNDFQFRGRIKVAALKYAAYIMDEASNVPAHSTRVRWAADTYRNPEMASQTLHSPVVMDSQVQTDGAAITDPNLQIAVEKIVNDLM